MAVVIDGTTGISTPAETVLGNLSYTGTLTGNGGIVNLGSGQVYKDASGNVGIGTSSPLTKVTAYQGSAQSPAASGSMNTGFMYGQGATDPMLNFGTDSDGIWYNAAYANNAGIGRIHRWLTGGSERARIDSSGNLLVGTTTVDAAGSKIQLSSSQNRVFTIQNTANVNGDQGLWIKLGTNANTTASPALLCETGGTNRLIVWGNGNVVNTNNSYGAISDIKLKENIVDATPKLDKLNQVRIVNYNLIGEEQKQLGVIAQELEQIFPSMIDETPDLDAEGIDLGTTTKSVKYSVFVPMLIKAIQEQQTTIVSLQDTLAALTARITALEGTA